MDKLDIMVAHNAISQTLSAITSFPQRFKLMSRFPNTPLTNAPAHLASFRVPLEINHDRRIPTSTIFRDQGDVAG